MNPLTHDQMLAILGIRKDDEIARRRLEALLLEGLEGERIEMTDEGWEEMLRDFDARQRFARE